MTLLNGRSLSGPPDKIAQKRTGMHLKIGRSHKGVKKMCQDSHLTDALLGVVSLSLAVHLTTRLFAGVLFFYTVARSCCHYFCRLLYNRRAVKIYISRVNEAKM